MLEFSVSEIIFTIINFVVLVALLGKFLYKPITKMMDDRKTAIDEALDAAEAARIEVASTETRLQAQIAEARKESEAILADARKRAESSREEIVAEARREALAISKAAAMEIENEQRRAIAELKEQIADMVVLTTEKLLADGLTQTQQQTLLDQYVKEVGQLQ